MASTKPSQIFKGSVNKVLMAGDVIGEVTSETAIKLGPGLTQNQNSICATKAGVLRFKAPDTYFVENNQKRVQRHFFSSILTVLSTPQELTT